MKIRTTLVILPILMWWSGKAFCQQAIFLTNPSFEDNPRYGHTPTGWRNCAFNNESPPDIHPIVEGEFRVEVKPVDGETYLGLVVRDTRTTESVGQALSTPLEAGRCYTFSMALCSTDQFFSRKRSGNGLADFGNPAVLRIWGGISPCGQKSLLAESPLVSHPEWRLYTFLFQTPDSLSWISFEAYYAPGAEAPYNGNLLLDHASPILPIDCATLQPLVDPDTVTAPRFTFPRLKTFGLKKHYVQNGYGGYANMTLRTIKSADDLEALLLLNCPDIGFVTGKWHFYYGAFTPLKEVAYNVSRFPETRLIACIHFTGEKVTKKRIKFIRAAFREVGLKKDQYQIIVDDNAGVGEGWYCNQEIWLRIERE